MSVLLGQPLFDLRADTLKQRSIRVAQPEVSGVDPSQDGTEFDEQGSEIPVHSDAPCKAKATHSNVERK